MSGNAGETPVRFVVCAACRKDGVVVAGARHLDGVMRGVMRMMGMGYAGWEQGFIDQFGVFMTREEAWEVADKAGQIRRPTGWEKGDKPRPPGAGDKGSLFSENLY